MKKLSAVIPAEKTDEILRALQHLSCVGIERLDTPDEPPGDDAIAEKSAAAEKNGAVEKNDSAEKNAPVCKKYE